MNLKELRTLDLGYNLLSMEIPTHIGNLSHLTTLDLSNKKLTSRISSSMENLSSILNLKELKTLNLRHNVLSMWIPIHIGDLFHLTTLDLSNKLMVESHHPYKI